MPNGASSLEQAMFPQQALMNDALPHHTPSPLSADADATVIGTDIVCLADLQPQPVEWLWQHRLAAGTLPMLSEEQGSGKPWVALAIAAALTRGPAPFTGEKLKRATALYAAAEHAASQVIQPRFAGNPPKTENQGHGGGLCPLRRISTRRSPRQDAQMNYLSTLSIFMKQTTYLATLPNPNLKANECHCLRRFVVRRGVCREIQDRRNYPPSSKASGVSGVISSV
jgi:hypothetical protein